MQPDPNNPMNGLMRTAGNRSRALPNIGQTPAVQAANVVMGQQPQPAPAMGGAPASVPSPAPALAPSVPVGASPMAAPAIQPNTMTLHPPGSQPDANHYNYEPQADGSWRVYPPGVGAPNHTVSASLPRAASTADYKRMRQAFMQQPQSHPPV